MSRLEVIVHEGCVQRAPLRRQQQRWILFFWETSSSCLKLNSAEHDREIGHTEASITVEHAMSSRVIQKYEACSRFLRLDHPA